MMNSKTRYKLLTSFFKETLFIQVLLASLFVFLVWFFNFSLNLGGESNGQYASLLINFEDKKRMFEGDVVDGMTILDALGASSIAGNIEFNYSQSSDGKIQIKQLNGYSGGVRKPYFYLNGHEVSAENIGSTLIKAGDKVEVLFR